MTPTEQVEALALVDELVRRSKGTNQLVATKLRHLLAPPPRIADLLLQVPGDNNKERAERLGISYQGFYNLLRGGVRPNSKTRHQLALLTGLSEDMIRRAAL